MRRFPRIDFALVPGVSLVAFALLSGCGAGTAALVSGSGSGSSNAATVLSGFRIAGAKVSPATIEFTTNDEESDPARIAFLYALPGESPRPMTQLAPLTPGLELSGNVATATSAPNGVTHRLTWSFVDEAGLPADGSYLEGATVLAQVEGGTQGLVLGANAEGLGLGNDPPTVLAVTLPSAEEVSGVVPVDLIVADSSSDVVSLRIEYDVVGDQPDAGWQLALPASASGGGETPEFALEGIETTEDGVGIGFFWDTDHDLFQEDVDVRLRVTADDRTLDLAGNPIGLGPSLASDVIRVDNNEVPVLTMQGEVLLSNEDGLWGIPIPYSVLDPEGDPVSVLFQYRRPGDAFPDLPQDEVELEAILSDPGLRAEYQVCTPYQSADGGRVTPVDEDTVILSELQSSMNHLLATGILGAEIELLRASSHPQQVAHTWAENPLIRPVAALSLGDGRTAMVLDALLAGGWLLREIELATGTIVRTVASSPTGAPSAMAMERYERSVLLASELAGVWSIERVVLASGASNLLATAEEGGPVGTVHGVASIGSQAAVITVDEFLLRLDFPLGGPARVHELASGLEAPWGVVLDPRDASRVLLTERDAQVAGGRGRVVRVRLDTGELQTLEIDTAGLGSAHLKRPGPLAVTGPSRGLLTIARTGAGGEPQLVALHLGAAARALALPVDESLPEAATAIACGPDGLRIVCLADDSDLGVGGGVEQRRRIAALDISKGEISVTEPFKPSPRVAQRWRPAVEGRLGSTSSAGADRRFIWDTSDVSFHGKALLRGAPRDTELGIVGSIEAGKQVRSPFPVEPTLLGGSAALDGPRSVAAADLDGDGDLDIFLPNFGSEALTVFLQVAPGTFQTNPIVLGGPGVTDRPQSVTAGDLDGDGDLDIVSANSQGNNLTVFFQTAPGSFETDPLVLGGIDYPVSVAAADLDADGDLDIVSANQDDHDLTIFYQLAPGSFDTQPLVLGGPGVISHPQSVTVADLDADGDLDILSANLTSDDLTVFFQTTSGLFEADPLRLGGPGVIEGPQFATAADLDGDGDLDILSANHFSNDLTIFFQTAPGSFEVNPLVLGGNGIVEDPWSVVATDLDSDGDLDILSANHGSDDLTAFFQTTPGCFEREPLVFDGVGVTPHPSSVLAADLDSDGDVDILSTTGPSDDLLVFFQEAPGTFEPDPLALEAPGVIDKPSSAIAADLDGDGDLDVLSTNASSQNLTVFFQVTPGAFEANPLVLGGPGATLSPVSAAAADLDTDGDLDVLCANSTGDDLTVFFQTAPGSFETEPLVLGGPSVMGRPLFVTAADLDADGDLDILSANFDSDDLTLFFQVAPGAFGTDPLVLGGPGLTDNPQSVAAADLDADGDVDILSANRGGSTLTIFFQLAPGTFSSDPLVIGEPGTTPGPSSVAAADMDADGDLDILSAHPSGNKLTIFYQLTPGTFSSDPFVIGGPGITDSPEFVVASDLDADGDLDVVSANYDDVRILFQIAPHSFEMSRLYLSGPFFQWPSTVSAADMDGDGDLDILSSNENLDNLTIFYGGR